MNTTDPLMPTLPSYLATSVTVPNTTKELKINSSNTNKRSRLSSNHISSNSSFVWPGVDAIVESYRKYNQDCSAEVASLQQQIQCLQQELATKRAHVDSLSTQMASLVRHQKGMKQLNENLENNLQLFKATLIDVKKVS